MADETVTFADIAFFKTESGLIAAGVQLSRRMTAEEGFIFYEPYVIISGLYDIAAGSIRQAIPVVTVDVIRIAAHSTRIIVLRSNSRTFLRSCALENELGLLALDRGIEIKILHNPHIHRTVPDVQRLCNDAIERGSTIICVV
jgi:hypothetical protein